MIQEHISKINSHVSVKEMELLFKGKIKKSSP